MIQLILNVGTSSNYRQPAAYAFWRAVKEKSFLPHRIIFGNNMVIFRLKPTIKYMQLCYGTFFMALDIHTFHQLIFLLQGS
ncbi:MAG: hypothetical protein CVT99_04425 [Bacteroidetes bacterium HGW-Bacteroidetes-16]|nr:MAG: hypothetical protein CVT99_04425 [Bacteroidetes bacterium HGW-Bacteroidetes-16]